jgi:hypothetical protein
MASSGELFAGFGDAGLDGGDELEGVMLVPARKAARLAVKMVGLDQKDAAIPRMWVHLLELDLMRGHWVALGVENEEAGTGGAIVNGAHEDVLAVSSRLACQRFGAHW